MKQYGYCCISTGKQNMERQVRNIKTVFPEAVIIKEVYTGTKFQGWKELDKLLGKVQRGDRIIFDSVSRMSRNAGDGFQLYEELYKRSYLRLFIVKVADLLPICYYIASWEKFCHGKNQLS